MKNDAIGVFDSGMGGLTTVKELNRLLPHENIIYFGDTARVPYGSRSPETILRYAKEDVAFLRQYQVKMIIAACGTVSSIVGDQPFVTDVPFAGVIYPAVEAACAVTKTKRIGIIGTSATIKSKSYEKAILQRHPDFFVATQACPLFVHLVENGYTDFNNPVTRLVAEEYLTPIKEQKVDTLILGCTHYPVIADLIGDIMGRDVALISPGAETAGYAKKCLAEQNLLSDRTEKGKNTYYVSDSVSLFTENAAHTGRGVRCGLSEQLAEGGRLLKEKVEIILRSVQRNEEEENETELRTEGVYEHDGKNWSVSYEESEATGFEDSTTEITGTDGRCVSIVRRGSANSNLMIETGKKHYCLYGTPFGDMTLGIYTNKIEDNLSPQGGQLYLRYTLDVNASFLSDNEIYLEVVTQQEA